MHVVILCCLNLTDLTVGHLNLTPDLYSTDTPMPPLHVCYYDYDTDTKSLQF